MDVTGLIQTYGYWAVAAGTFLEGETVLLAAAAAASRNYLRLPAVIAIAAVCGFLGDQLFFFLGHRYGARLVVRFPLLQARTARVQALLKRHDAPLILVIRFLYGLRVAGAIAMGTSGVHWARFAVFNFAGAVIWATVIASIGYGLGQGLSHLVSALGEFDDHEIWVLAAIAGLIIVWRLAVHGRQILRTRRHRQQTLEKRD